MAQNGHKAAILEGFVAVNRTYDVVSAARDKAQLTVSTSGISKSNAFGKDRVLALLKSSGIPLDNARLKFHASPAKGQVGVEVVASTEAGASEYRQYAHSVSFHLGAVFAEHEELRPATKVKCNLVPAEVPGFLLIILAGALPVRRGTTDTSASTAEKK